MSFNVGNFISNAVKSPIQKVVDSVVGQVASGIQSSVSSVASSFSQQLFSIGQSFDSISAISSLKVDSIVSGGSNDYSGFAGKCVERASASGHGGAAASTRGMTSKEYSTNISPQGKIAGATYAAQAGVDVYPPDIGKYQMRFDFMTYKRPAPFTPVTTDVTYSLVLNAPAELVESYSMSWADEPLGMIGDAADAFTRKHAHDLDGFKDAAYNAAISGGAQVMRSLQNSKMLGTTTSAAEQFFGIVPNPNISVMFKGPKLRQHGFSWQFAPRTPDESRTIQKIIKELRNRSLAKASKEGGTAILGYPDMVKITLSPDSNDGEPLYKFKTCVVDRISVSYAQGGVPVWFKGTNLPAFISLRIDLQEIEMVLHETETLAEAYTTTARVGKDISALAGDFRSAFNDTTTARPFTPAEAAAANTGS
jgi:hypothetical protein